MTKYEEHMATPAEACDEYVRNFGMDNSDREWILSQYDTWHRNPFFTGTRTNFDPRDAERE